MCYSKEVTLTVGTVMAIGIAYTWKNYVKNEPNEKLRSVYNDILVGYSCVALHQFGEFFALLTEKSIIYKMGLIASLACMFFYMRALEKLSQYSFGSNIFAWLIGLTAFQILLAPTHFENFGFWVRGENGGSYLLWSSIWLALFIYWNICLFYYRRFNPSLTNKKILIYYGLYTINFSFILYLIYAYFSLFMKAASRVEQGTIRSIFENFDILKDSPSIWCIFSLTQVILIPLLFKMMSKEYDLAASVHFPDKRQNIMLKLIGISTCIWLFILIVFPMLFDVALKMILT